MRYAGFWSRLGAGFVDFLILLPVTIAYTWASSVSRTMAMALLLPATLLYATYPIYFHGRWGQSLGKMCLGIKVVSLDGAPISWRQAFLRFSVGTLIGIAMAVSQSVGIARIAPEEYASLPWLTQVQRIGAMSPGAQLLSWINTAWVYSEFFVLLFNKRKRALHDFIAGTVVVHVAPETEAVGPEVALPSRS